MVMHKSGTRWPDDREAGWSSGRSTSYTCRARGARVFRLSLKTGGDDFPVWPQNWWLRFSGLGLKTTATVFPVWPQNWWLRFLGLGLKTKRWRFIGLDLKTDGRMELCWRARVDIQELPWRARRRG